MSEKPFRGFVEHGRLKLDHQAQFMAYVAAKFEGCEVDVTVTERDARKTRDQEKGFHAMIAPWAKDEGYRIDDLKLDLLGEIFGWSETPSPLTGKVVPLETSTSKLSKKKYSQLIEETLVIAARCGYVLIAPDEYRLLHPAKYPATPKAKRRAA